MRTARPFCRLASFCFVATIAVLPAAAQSGAVYRQVQGTLEYEEGGSLARRPIRSIQASIYPLSAPSNVSVVSTDSRGYFSANLRSASIPPGSYVEMTFQARNFAADVYLELDGANDRMTWRRRVRVPSGSAPVDLGGLVTVGNVSAHFNIAECLRVGHLYASARRGDTDAISRADVEYPDASWSHYNSFWNEIKLSGPRIRGYGGAVDPNTGAPVDRGFRDETILHEYGHYLTDDISDHDGTGGPHTETQDLGYEFAWMEGFPTYYAHAVEAAYPADVTMTRSLETNLGGPAGSEATTWACLWDLHDGLGTETFDRVNGTASIRTAIFQIFDSEIDRGSLRNGTSISRTILGFRSAWANRQLSPAADLDAVFAG
ncbi:MAG: hypothetical protein HY720_27530, partial [Planctomycetes bacterium]|nr:hypothetical protein [Planctomycetota bacterium]